MLAREIRNPEQPAFLHARKMSSCLEAALQHSTCHGLGIPIPRPCTAQWCAHLRHFPAAGDKGQQAAARTTDAIIVWRPTIDRCYMLQHPCAIYKPANAWQLILAKGLPGWLPACCRSGHALLVRFLYRGRAAAPLNVCASATNLTKAPCRRCWLT